jgi:hypothetical protein
MALDFFVKAHAAVAFGFGSACLAAPQFFDTFSKESVSADSVTGDAIRWSAPFILGFSAFAYSSISFPGVVRKRIAEIFLATFTLATALSVYVQAQGRWKQSVCVNTGSFVFLAVGYAYFLFFDSQSFSRNDEARVPLRGTRADRSRQGRSQ